MMSREEKSKQRHETHSSSSPAAIIIMVITAIITVLYIRLVHRAIEVIYSCLFLLGVFFFCIFTLKQTRGRNSLICSF